MTTVPNATAEKRLVKAVESCFGTKARLDCQRKEMHTAMEEFLRPDSDPYKRDPNIRLSKLSEAYQEVTKLDGGWRQQLVEAFARYGHDFADEQRAAMDPRQEDVKDLMQAAQEVGIWQGRLEEAERQVARNAPR